jgi:DNA processing protein
MYRINSIIPDEDNFLQIIGDIDKTVKSLYIMGNVPNQRRPTIAIVGTRKPTPYGQEVGYQIAYELAKQGVVIVSGLALGMDAIAHRAALDAGGLTLAILPSHPSAIVPRTNFRLAQEIVAKDGALISEYAEHQPIYKQNFLARNRIVSAISDGVLIIEAAKRSGTLATAAYGLAQGKTIMAIPGAITQPMSAGCNRLIAQGAHLITCAQDVLEILGWQSHRARQTSLPFGETFEEQAILQLLLQGVRDGDELQQQSRLNPSLFAQTLTLLEIQSKIKALGANQWGL